MTYQSALVHYLVGALSAAGAGFSFGIVMAIEYWGCTQIPH